MTRSVTSRKFETAVAFVLSDRIEGGYANDPNDRGGPTNRGVSLRAVRQLDAEGKLDAFLKAEFDMDNDGDIDGADVPNWTIETARKFYDLYYWKPINGDQLPWPLALLVFDSAVNEGVQAAVRHLQKTVRATEDGVVSQETLKAAARYAFSSKELLARQFCVNRLDRYRGLSDADRYFRSWAGRVLDTYIEYQKELV